MQADAGTADAGPIGVHAADRATGGANDAFVSR
jgi:hypothetical protein